MIFFFNVGETQDSNQIILKVKSLKLAIFIIGNSLSG